jgi:putative heme-binding domain-containing protein
MDEYVAYTLESALGALYPIWEPMLAKGTIAAGNAKGLEQLVAYDEGRKPYGQAPRLIKTLMNSEADARTKERAMRDLTRMKGKVEAGSIVSTRICITCHKFGAAGTELGPDLADVGKRLSKEELVRSILYPNEKIDPKFLTVNITTKKRDEISGIVAAEDENTVTIRMGAGEQQVVKKADIAKRVTLKVSSMPEDLVQTMSPQEFVDLIEYLASKK